MNRRKFLEMTSLGTAAAVTPDWFTPVPEVQKLRIGLIGAGWYGMVITKAALDAGGAEVAAVCDVDSGHLNSSADELANIQGSRPRTFKH